MTKIPTGLMISDVEKMLNDTPGHIYWKDREGRYLGCNLRQAQSCGFDSIEAFVGKNDFELIAHEEAEIIRANDLEVMASNAPWIKEETVELKGKMLTFLSHKQPLRNDQGEVVGIIGMSFDITDKKQLIDSISGAPQEGQKKYKAALTGIPKADQDFLKAKSCIMTISVNQEYHEGEKLRAVLHSVNKQFKSCTIAVCDTLQRRSIEMLKNVSAEESYRIALQDGDEWIARHKEIIEQELQIPYQIIRWDHWLNNAKFTENSKKVNNLFASSNNYKMLVKDTVDKFWSRQEARNNNFSRSEKAITNSIEYILEESACMLQWLEEGYHYDIYPPVRSEALSMAFTILEPARYKSCLRPLGVRFTAINNEIQASHFDHVALDTIIKTLPGHIYWKDINGSFLGCNLKQAISFGFKSMNDIISKSDFDFYDYDTAIAIRKNDLEVMRKHHTFIKEESVELKGKKHTFLSHKVPLKDSSGGSLGILGVSLDITRQKELEAELVEKNNLLEDALNAKTAFINNISHEIRTPVHGFTALAEGLALNWDKFDDKKRHAVSLQIASNAKRISNLLGHLLDLSKFNEGKMQLTLEEFDLVELINNFIAEAKALYIAEKNITINFVPNSSVMMNADRERISQVLRNVIVNAIKFSPKNSAINISLNHIEFDGNKAIEIIVTDQGVGIPDSELEKIFEPFTQSSKTITKAGGTGLGLAIVKEIVDLHHGKVWAKNNPDRGANFHIILPIIDMSVERHIPQKEDRNYNILMIDDEEICLTGTELFLTLAPEYNLIKCRNGLEALDYLKDHQDVDLILLDMMMPDMDGIEVLEALNKDDHLRKIPVLLQSGISDEKEMNKAQELNATNFIAKPYNSKQLINKLNKMLA